MLTVLGSPTDWLGHSWELLKNKTALDQDNTNYYTVVTVLLCVGSINRIVNSFDIAGYANCHLVSLTQTQSSSPSVCYLR